jgi:ubiquinone/menaquinone biosynthesis C-methylase UbiE
LYLKTSGREKMNIETLELLCDPKTHSSLEFKNNMLISQENVGYKIEKGIPIFLKEGDVTGLNKKYQGMYDFIAKGYDLFTFLFKFKLFAKYLGGDDRSPDQAEFVRLMCAKGLTIKSGDKVLETSIGTGANLPYLTKTADYYGVDISSKMMKICQRNNKKWGYKLQLVQANAEELPFRDESFDSVFHFGGINFFNDMSKAIKEMIRVAKPGTKILICDETQEQVDEQYKKMPFIKKYFKDAPPVVIPIDLVPKEMKDIKLEILDERMYVITFVKP